MANNRAEGRNSAVVYKSRLVTGFWWKITDDGNVLFTKQHFISLGISLVKSCGFMAQLRTESLRKKTHGYSSLTLGGGFKDFLFSPHNPGEIVQCDVRIFFQMGWGKTTNQ